MIVPVVTAGHYWPHLDPILELVPHRHQRTASDDVALVASFGDLRVARKQGFGRFVVAQHGIGQSYSSSHPSYPGGRSYEGVDLFLAPNEHAAARWRATYPSADVAIIGSPAIESLPLREPGPTLVAISSHWDCRVAPESGSARAEFAGAFRDLGRKMPTVGHGHPRIRDRRRFFERLGIPHVADFAEICRRASVYICDNSSTLYEFASTGRPVVVLNSRRYRPSANHGLRFESDGRRFIGAADVGIQVDDPRDLVAAVERALEDPPEVRAARERALDLVYQPRYGGARVAAEALGQFTALPRAA